MKGFCRRCHAQVMRDSGDCPDCVVMAITPFEKSATVDEGVNTAL
jgi:hypothetical protein